MKVHDRELILYSDPLRPVAKKVLAYASSLGSRVQARNFHQAGLSATSWRQILGMLGLAPKQLVDKSDPYYQKNLRGRNFSEDDWINILSHRPGLIRGTIALRGNRAIFVNNPSDILRLT